MIFFGVKYVRWCLFYCGSLWCFSMQLTFFQQHGCWTKEAHSKYTSRAASLYRDRLHNQAVSIQKTYGNQVWRDERANQSLLFMLILLPVSFLSHRLVLLFDVVLLLAFSFTLIPASSSVQSAQVMTFLRLSRHPPTLGLFQVLNAIL